MKDLQSQFDRLPQDFDREAIWAGVVKPRPPVYYRVHFWLGTSLAGALIAAFVVSYLYGTKPDRRNSLTTVQLHAMGSCFSANPFQQPEETAVFAFSVPPWPAKSAQQVLFGERGAMLSELKSARFLKTEQPKLAEPQENRPAEASLTVARLVEKKTGKATGIDTAQQAGYPDTKKEKAAVAGRHSQPEIEPGAAEPKKQAAFLPGLNALAARPAAVTLPPDSLLAIATVSPLQARLSSRHSLALRAGVGLHGSHFSSPDAELLQWRSKLEQPQLGYWLGLRYEYRLKHQILLSLSANYYLYKERVLNRNTLYLPDQVKQLDYKLHNHYHVFTTQVEVGKRFFYGSFFWDVTAGGGLKAHQLTEADYFQSASELAPSEQVQAAYRSSARAFATAQAAVGRQLNQRVFVRLGAQFSSGLELTAPQAAVTHQLRPYQFFVEAGVRL